MCYLVGEEMGFGQLWGALWARGQELGIDVRNDERIVELVMSPETGDVAGIKDEAGNAYKARKGVLLSCGGFENDPDMISQYFQIGYYETRPYGTPYNRGDGIKMAAGQGAELWHMNNFANSGYGNLSAGEDCPCVIYSYWPKRDYIYVGPDGTRFVYEETNGLARHGKYLTAGCATNMVQPVETWAIFGSETFDDQSREGCIFQQDFLCGWNVIHDFTAYHSNQEYLDAGLIFKGETVEELAEQIGLDPETLASTVATYNANAENNEDPLHHRGTAVYSAFNYGAQGTAAMEANYGSDGGTSESLEAAEGEMTPSIFPFNLVPLQAPYYACRMYTGTLNTQGGPKRDATGNIVRWDGSKIGRLYGAGEMGTIYAYNYNGGGNVSDAMSSGRLAARSIGALEAWA